MPLPKPVKNERHSNWIRRCMSNDTMKSEFKDIKQRYAVCEDLWKNRHKEKSVLFIDLVGSY